MCIPGTVLGAFISDVMTPVVFQILFALILVSSAVYIFVKRKITEKPYNLKNSMMIFAAAASFFAGIISSLFGIGGGVVFVPLNQKIVGVKSVVLHDNMTPYYESPMRASFDGFAESMKSAPILSGDEEIRTNVSVVFYISQE